GECRRAAGTYFKYGQTGHLQKDCKKNIAASTSGQADKKLGASGRVFAITEDHATKTSDHVLCISTPMKDSVRITHVYRDLPLQFDDKIRAINALPPDMCEFDIILGKIYADHFRFASTTHLKGSLPHGSDRIKGVKGSVTGIVGARLYSSEYVTM
nr:hypothetical protein [Tanacetum cinerariifolium]